MKLLSHVQLFATPWAIAHQAPPPMEFSRQEYWSCHFLLQGILPTQGSNPGFPDCRQTYKLSHQGSPGIPGRVVHSGPRFHITEGKWLSFLKSNPCPSSPCWGSCLPWLVAEKGLWVFPESRLCTDQYTPALVTTLPPQHLPGLLSSYQ